MPGIGVGAQVQGFQDLHLRAVEPFQGALHADPAAGPGGEGCEVRHAGGNEVRPRGEQGPQRIIAACLQFLAERADKGHQSNVTFRPVLRVRRRAATPSITSKSISRNATGSP